MAGWIKTGQFTSPASGTTVIDITDKGNDAKGIHLWCTNNTSLDTQQIHSVMNHGFSDGTNDRSILHNTDQAAITGLNTRRSNSTTLVLSLENPPDDVVLLTITAAAMNANDVTLTYGTFTAGHIINFTIFGGSDCSVEVGDTPSNDASSPLTGIAFAPEFGLYMTHGAAANDQSQFSFQSFGVSDGTNEWCLFAFQGANSPDNKGSVLIENEVTGQMDLQFADWGATILAMTSDGFTYENVPTADTGGTDIFFFLLVSYAGTRDVDIGTFTKVTGAAPVTQQMPDLGFTPQAYFLASANDVGTDATAANNCRVSFGAYDGDDGQSCIETAESGAADAANSHSRTHASEVLQISQLLNTVGIQASATPDAITDSTPSFEWNPNTSAATIIGYYALAGAAASEQEGFRFRNDDGSESAASWRQAQDVDDTIAKNVNFRLRTLINSSGDLASAAYRLDYKETGDPDAEYRQVPLT